MRFKNMILPVLALIAVISAPGLTYSQDGTLQPAVVVPEQSTGENTNQYETYYNSEGYDEKGFDKNGYDREGYDIDGYDKNGYNRYGINREGYDANGKYHTQPYYYDKEDPAQNNGGRSKTKENPGYDPAGDYNGN